MKKTFKDFADGFSFDPLPADGKTPCEKWGVFGAHDPSMIEADGKYYVFSTGTFGRELYQIRRSDDLVHWQFAGEAFENFSALAPAVQALEEVFGGKVKTPNLWAPDVVPAADGGYWLYGCYTGVFGDNYSVIFLAHSQKVEGPYSYVDTLVVSGGDWGLCPNAIDPQIFYDGAGQMFMTYGSFYGGIRILALDPATGRRKDALTYRQYKAGACGREAYYGKKILPSSNVEGSVVAYKKGVRVYQGDIFAGEESENWTRKDKFFLMGSADSLSLDYNMRLWASDAPEGPYTRAPYGYSGQKVASSFSWRYSPDDVRVGYDFYVPGHNDLFTTSEGVDLIVYHNRTPYSATRGHCPHYLFVSLYAHNSAGDIVMSPNRYAGERLRPVSKEELLSVSGGQYDYIKVGSGNFDCAYAKKGFCLGRDGGVMLRGERLGEWKLYGDHYVAFTFDGMRYLGVAMPAFIESEKRGGITVSARGEDGLPFFLNSVPKD